MSNYPVYELQEPPFPLVPSGISNQPFLETVSSEGIESASYEYDFTENDTEENDESRSGSEDISTPGPSGNVGKKSSSASRRNHNGNNNGFNYNKGASAGAPIAAGGAEGGFGEGIDETPIVAGGVGAVKKAGTTTPTTQKVFKDEEALNKYLKRRQNNNAAACKSRMKKKEMEQQNVERANRLEAENLQLRTELQQLEFEAKYLKEVLQSVLSKKTGN